MDGNLRLKTQRNLPFCKRKNKRNFIGGVFMKYRKIKKRIASLLVAFALATPYTITPMNVFAEEDDPSFDASYFNGSNAKSSYSTKARSSGSSASLQSKLATAIALQTSSIDENSTTSLESIDNISDIEVGLTANPESYRWATWYRKNAEDDLDTSDANGNYHGFSLDKIKAWANYSDDIKKINDGSFPELKDYTYPTTTIGSTLDFWADKPGVYDVYGDPHYSQVVLTAKVDVTYTTKTETQVLVDYTDSDSAYPDASAGGSGIDGSDLSAGGGGGSGIPSKSDICSNLSKDGYKQIKALYKSLGKKMPKGTSSYETTVKTCKSAGKNKKKKKNSGGKKKASIQPVKKDSYQVTVNGWLETGASANAQYIVKSEENMKDLQKASDDIGMLKKNENYKNNEKCSKDTNKSIYDSSGNKDLVDSLCKKSTAKKYQPQKYKSLSSNIDKQEVSEDGRNYAPTGGQSGKPDTALTGKKYATETTTEQHTKTVVIAQCVINDVYGSQLERVGTVGVGEKVGTWNMEEDKFWQDTPSYYSEDTPYITVDNRNSDNAFDTKEYTSDGNDVLTGDDSDDSEGDMNCLIFGFSRTDDSDVIGGEVTFDDLTVQQHNMKHGYNMIPDSKASIDPSLDVNNANSKYAGKIPLVDFKVSGGETTQSTRTGLKKYVILTAENEADKNATTNSGEAKNDINDSKTSHQVSHSSSTKKDGNKTIITDVTTKVTTIEDQKAKQK